jgi:hypothetical protein
MKCTHCPKEATTYCIVEEDTYACDEHAVGDYFWEL